jgi:hypothetical protein
MRKPRLEDFDPNQHHRQPDDINTQGLIPLASKPPLHAQTPVYSASASEPVRETFAGKPDIGQLDNGAIGQAGMPESLLARNLADCVRAALESKAAKKESFRFPDELMGALEDLPYELKKTYGKRVTKTAIFVAAIAAYLWDFKHNGQSSQLYQHLIETEHA